ncbi:MAG: ribbon-helix-helix domain-containing protein [Fervidicoccaceae archaeon]
MRLRIITFKIDEETLMRLDAVSRKTGIVRSDLIRKAIELYLNKIENELEQRPRIRVMPRDIDYEECYEV